MSRIDSRKDSSAPLSASSCPARGLCWSGCACRMWIVVGASNAHDRAREDVRACRLPAGRGDPRRTADDGLVRDPAAVGPAVDELPPRCGPAHRRAPDNRPRRPGVDHPPAPAGRPPTGASRDTITFPAPGRYRVVVDAYPNLAGPQRNFQLFRRIDSRRRVTGHTPLPPSSADRDGRRIPLHAAGRPRLSAITPAFLTVTVTDPNGTPARFTPWYGALAHAIFFRAGLARLLPHARLQRPARAAARARSAGRR